MTEYYMASYIEPRRTNWTRNETQFTPAFEDLDRFYGFLEWLKKEFNAVIVDEIIWEAEEEPKWTRVVKKGE